MKAVNLIPAELRRGDTSGGHSGGVVYVVLAALAVLVVLTAAWAGLGKQINDRKAQAVELKAEADVVEARAGKLAHYESAAADAKTRVEKVRTLATSRFDWPHTFREVSRLMPKEAWVQTMVGTIGTNVSVEGGGNPLRTSENAPALELEGCTARQDSVAKLMAQLRAMDGVTRVMLSASEKNDLKETAKAGAATAQVDSSDCRGSSDRPQFNMVVFFRGTGQEHPGTAGAPAAGAAANGTPPNGTNGSGAAQSSGTNGSTPPAPSSSPSTPTGGAS